MYTADPLVPEPSPFKDEIATEKLQRCKSPGTDHISTQLIQVGGNTIHSEIHRLINCIWGKEEMPHQWKEPIILPVYKKGDETD
jgi:hypothetical protein